MTEGVEWTGKSPFVAAFRQKDKELKDLAMNILDELKPHLKHPPRMYGVAHVDCDKCPAGICIHHIIYSADGKQGYEPCEFCGRKP